jgi:hypothetical protein
MSAPFGRLLSLQDGLNDMRQHFQTIRVLHAVLSLVVAALGCETLAASNSSTMLACAVIVLVVRRACNLGWIHGGAACMSKQARNVRRVPQTTQRAMAGHASGMGGTRKDCGGRWDAWQAASARAAADQ